MQPRRSSDEPAPGGRVALVVDNPRRDLSGVALVGRELALRGHEVFLVPMNLRTRELPALAPDHVAVNYLRSVNDEAMGRLMDAGVRVSVLDTEGAVFQEVEALVAKMSRRTEVTERIWRYCAWGRYMADFLVEHGFYRAEQVAVTGPPRMDFYVAPWRKAAEATSPAQRLPDRPMILLCGSFPFANPRFRTPEEQLEMRIEVSKLDREFVQREFDKDAAGLEAFIDLAIGLAEARPETTFVYRPHPFERIETYRQRFAALSNIRIEADGLIDGWILRSTATVQPADCTTAVEAAIAGVPSLLADWVPGDRVAVVEAVSERCEDLPSLLARIDELISADSHGERRVDEQVRALFGDLDGEAHLRVATELSAACRSDPGLDEDGLRRLHYVPESGTGLTSSALGHIRMRLGLPALWSVRSRRQRAPLNWDRGAKSFTATQVHAMMRALDDASPDERGCVSATGAGEEDYRFGFAVGRSVRLKAVARSTTAGVQR